MATQSRNPTSDTAVSGTWTGSAGTRYTLVDDYPDSGGSDYLTHGTTAGYIVLGFSAFSIPAASAAISVAVNWYDQKTGSPGCNIRSRLRVGGTDYNHAASIAPATSITARSQAWATNPRSAAAWTVDDINGVGGNALTGVGWYSTDASPTINLTSIQIEVTYTVAYTMPAAAGSYVLTGNAAILKADRVLTAAKGDYTLTGYDAGLAKGYTMPAAKGDYTLIGYDAGLKADRLLSATKGDFVLTGYDTGLRTDRALTAGVGAFVLTGQAASLKADRILIAETGDYALTGQHADLIADRILMAGEGAFILTGNDAGLVYTPVGAYILTAEAGAFILTGQDAGLRADRNLTAEPGAYILVGNDAGLTYVPMAGAYTLTAATGHYALNLKGASLTWTQHPTSFINQFGRIQSICRPYQIGGVEYKGMVTHGKS